MRMVDEAVIELLDAGDGRRLERFGVRTLDRPAPAATSPRRWPAARWVADLRFDPGTGWTGPTDGTSLAPWTVAVGGLTVELRGMTSGGVGLYPEQLANLPWLERQLEARGRELPVLNLFAHTGLLTLAAARAGAAVVHVDAARSSIAWARRNAALSGLDDRPIRWIEDDAEAFVAREARRQRRYGGLILDPPSFGRAGRGRWRLLDDLPALLEASRGLLTPDAFVLLTAHTTGLAGEDLADLVAAALGRPNVEVMPLGLGSASGARLDLGWAVRLE